MSDPRAVRAREYHNKSLEDLWNAGQHRIARDEVIRQIWASDRDSWTYERLAEAIGCSPELIAHIVKKK